MVVIHSGAHADGSLARATKQLPSQATLESGRVSEGKARGKIFVVITPIGWFAVGIAGKPELDRIIERLPSPHRRCPLVEPVIQAECGRDLHSVLLVRRLQKRPPEAISNG